MDLATKRDPDEELKRGGDELEERIERLGDHIDEARRTAQSRPEVTNKAAGDWEDSDDDAGGEDPSGFDDPEKAEEDDEDE
jgi:hypothetical protein